MVKLLEHPASSSVARDDDDNREAGVQGGDAARQGGGGGGPCGRRLQAGADRRQYPRRGRGAQLQGHPRQPQHGDLDPPQQEPGLREHHSAHNEHTAKFRFSL